MRRLPSALVALGLLLGSLVVFAQPAAARECGYPVAICKAQIMVSTTDPFVGQKIEISGKDFHSDEDVKLYIADVYVGTAHTDLLGSFDPPAITPNRPGPQIVKGVGASGQADDIATTPITIRVAGVAGESTGGGGGLASTGVKIAGLSLLAAALLIGGGLLARSGRRRRPSTHAV